MKHKNWWLLSAAVSLFLVAMLVLLWQEMNHYGEDRVERPSEGSSKVKIESEDYCAPQDSENWHLPCNSHPLATEQETNIFLKEHWGVSATDHTRRPVSGDCDDPKSGSEGDSNPNMQQQLMHSTGAKAAGSEQSLQKVKTGIFIQSLKFFNSTEVNLSGYIWQRYQRGLQDHIKPGPGQVGFILPQQVNSADDIEPREVYRHCTGAEETIGWYFEATLRQAFDYSDYPFDHKTVWVRMWHRLFSENIVLVPDYKAYDDKTGPLDIFGIDKTIVLGTWEREDTYFDYELSSYDTNFGIPDYIGRKGFPELRYNFVVKRKFENAFIVYLLPLFLVAALLFAALLTLSNRDDLSDRLGFNVAGFIGTCSALFFVVMLAHIQLRQQFAGSSIVYIEYFYILMYALLVVATANTYIFSLRPKQWCSLILYEDNIVFKVAYWPFVLGCLILITLWVLSAQGK